MARVEKQNLAPEAFENGMKPTTPEDAARGGFGPIMLDGGPFERMDGTKVDRIFFRKPNAVDFELRWNWLDEGVPSGTQFAIMLSRLSGYPLEELRKMDALDFADCTVHAGNFSIAFWNRVSYDPTKIESEEVQKA